MGKGGKKGKDTPCRFFSSPQGCTNDVCPFLHGASTAGPGVAAGASAKGSKKGGNFPCKFFGSARGCSNDACPFLHGSANAGFSNSAKRPAETANGTSTVGSDAAGQSPDGPCKFFGSARGCSTEMCPFSHADPNSVAPCSFKQKGSCEKGDACGFRHSPWGSPDEARAHYAAREKGIVEMSAKRFKQLHRDENPEPKKLGKEHVDTEGIVTERAVQVETYGSNAVKMMEKMGYKAGSGLGKDEQGSTRLAKPLIALETASRQDSALGSGFFVGSSKATLAERTARDASASAQKSQRVDEAAFVVNNLLSEDESSDDDVHIKARDIQLTAKPL